MPFKIYHWKLAFIAFALIGLFIRLGFWQLSRAEEKSALLTMFQARSTAPMLTAQQLLKAGDIQLYKVNLKGHFDNSHTILLDNKIFHGSVGYEVYTPFYAEGLNKAILIDRGFIPLGPSRAQLPIIKPILSTVTVTGLLINPPKYVALGEMLETNKLAWPLRVEFINMAKLTTILHEPLFPYLLTLKPSESGAYVIEWQMFSMGPERHQGYAVQWFAFALTLLILFVVLNRKSKNIQEKVP